MRWGICFCEFFNHSKYQCSVYGSSLFQDDRFDGAVRHFDGRIGSLPEIETVFSWFFWISRGLPLVFHNMLDSRF